MRLSPCLWVLAVLAHAAAARVVEVTSSQEFAAAFADNTVTGIMLVPRDGKDFGDIKLEAEDWPYTVDQPCLRAADVNIASDPELAVLDFNFLQVSMGGSADGVLALPGVWAALKLPSFCAAWMGQLQEGAPGGGAALAA